MKKVAVLLYGILIYLIFGSMAIIPNDISFPLIPYQLQSFDSLYYYKEYDKDEVVDEIEQQIGEEKVEKQTFENLNLFHNANVLNGVYADLQKKTYNYVVDGNGKQVSMEKDIKEIAEGYDCYGLPVNVGTDLYFLSDTSLCEGVKGFSVSISDDVAEEFGVGEYTFESVADLLEKQMKDSITKKEFSALVQLTLSKKICYWNSEEHIAVFSYKDSLIRYNTKDKTNKTFINRFYNMQTIVSSDELVYFDEQNKKIVLYNFATNESTDLILEVENIKSINYQYYEGFLNIILGLDGCVWSCIVKENELLSHGINFTGDFLKFAVCGDEIFILYLNEDDNKVNYGFSYVISDKESNKND